MEGPTVTVSTTQENGDVHTLESELDSPVDASSPIIKPLPSDDSGIVLDESRSPPADDEQMNGSVDVDTFFSDISPLAKNGESIETTTTVETSQTKTTVVEEKTEGENGETTTTYTKTTVVKETTEGENGEVEEECIVEETLLKRGDDEFLESEIMQGATDIPREDRKVGEVTDDDDLPEVTEVKAEVTDAPPKAEVTEEVISAEVKQPAEGIPEVTVTEPVPEVTITEAPDEEEEEEKETEPEVEPEPEPEPEPEEPRVEFVRGTPKCTDVEEALVILKTRYSLSGISAKKCILTWSCWNIRDMIRTPDDDEDGDANAPWWSGKQLIDDLPETEVVIDMLENICAKEKELQDLLDSVLEEERKKEEEKKKAEAAAKGDKPDIAITEAPITAEPAAQMSAEKPAEKKPAGENPDEVCKDPAAEDKKEGEDQPEKKKKRRNLLSRMVHAFRKRVGRNSSRRDSERDRERA